MEVWAEKKGVREDKKQEGQKDGRNGRRQEGERIVERKERNGNNVEKNTIT